MKTQEELTEHKKAGKILSLLTQAYGFTHDDLAVVTGIDEGSIRNIFHGDSRYADANYLALAKAFGFPNFTDLLERGEVEAERIRKDGVSYLKELGAALQKIANDKDILQQTVAEKADYSRITVKRVFEGALGIKSFQTYRDVATALGCASTDDAIRIASTLKDYGPFIEAVRTQWGDDMDVILQYRDMDYRESAKAVKLDYPIFIGILNGRRFSQENFQKISDYLGLSCEDAHTHAEDIRSKLMHKDKFGEIIRAYREHSKPPISRETLAKIFHPDNPEAGMRFVQSLENGVNKCSYKTIAQILRVLNFNDMHQLIQAAGLSDKYPNPRSGEKFVKRGIESLIANALKRAESEKDLDVPMSVLVRRKSPSGSGTPDL